MEKAERVMLGIAGLAYLASLISEILFNRIVLPESREQPPWEEFRSTGADLFRRIFRRRRPQLLQQAPFLSALIERGSILFYVLACGAFFAYLYLELESVSWIFLYLPAIVFAYFMSSLLALLLATLLVHEAGEEDEDGQTPEN